MFNPIISVEFENEILDLINAQLSEYNSEDGMDYSYTQSDLQLKVETIVQKILKKGQELA